MDGALPKSWENMVKEEIELQVNSSRWSKRFSSDDVIANHYNLSKKLNKIVREKIPSRLDVQYGKRPRAKLDIFGEHLAKDSYICVYVHGGYWLELEKNLSYHPVEQLYENKIVSIILGYTLAPDINVPEIVEEVKEGLKWICKLAKERGSKGVLLTGWSAGGQLIIQALSMANETEKSLFKIISGFVTFAGVFDLRLLAKSSVNDDLLLTDTDAWKISPLKNVDLLAKKFPHLKALIAFGENDSPEFKRQSLQYTENLKLRNMSAHSLEIPIVDHFDLVERLRYGDYVLTKEILNLVKK